MSKTDLVGRWGEAEAARFLRSRGYSIVAANYRCRFGEIDLIVSDRRYLVFVEVKLRKNDSHGAPSEFVDLRKQNKIKATASLWLAENETERQPRFDVVEIYAPRGISGEGIRINHIENAFE